MWASRVSLEKLHNATIGNILNQNEARKDLAEE